MSKVHFKAYQHVKSLLKNMSTSQNPYQHFINMPNIYLTPYQHIKYLIQSFSIYQKASQHFPNKLLSWRLQAVCYRIDLIN